MIEVIEVNGQKYIVRQTAQPQKRKYSKYLAAALAMGATMTYLDRPFKPRRRPTVDIVQEYGRIQRKESKLSRNDRDWVCRIFEENYKLIS